MMKKHASVISSVAIVLLAAVFYLDRRLTASKAGRAMLATKENERADLAASFADREAARLETTRRARAEAAQRWSRTIGQLASSTMPSRPFFSAQFFGPGSLA